MSRLPRRSDHESVRRHVEGALRELGTRVMPVDPPEVALARRTRTVSHLRALQARAAVRGQMARSWRKRVLIAALFLFPSGALAATWAMARVPFGERARGVAQGQEAGPGAVLGSGAAPRATRDLPPESAAGIPEVAFAPVPAGGREAVPRPIERRTRTTSPSPASVATGRHGSESSSSAREVPSLRSPSSERGASTLAAENAAMQSAMARVREGDDAGAIRRFTDFLARYPGSPLAENARVERSRAVARLHAGQAELGMSSASAPPP